MCATCGCDQEDRVTILIPGEEIKVEEHNLIHEHSHSHDHNGHHHHHHHHDHDHGHSHSHSHSIEVELERDVLSKNNLLAERNRGFFEARNMLAINLVSSPGSGKTTILEKTIQSLKEELPLFIVEGDQQTLNDAERIQNAGAPVVQVNTGKGCHLDSEMVNQAIKKLNPEMNSVFFIENVGNLVCPSLFDLGEQFRVVIMSTTEGEDKPIKYPNMFETSQLCLINKTDLLPYLNFDVEKAKEYALKVNPHLEILEVSATSGEGMDKWLEWLKEKVK